MYSVALDLFLTKAVHIKQAMFYSCLYINMKGVFFKYFLWVMFILLFEMSCVTTGKGKMYIMEYIDWHTQ